MKAHGTNETLSFYSVPVNVTVMVRHHIRVDDEETMMRCSPSHTPLSTPDCYDSDNKTQSPAQTHGTTTTKSHELGIRKSWRNMCHEMVPTFLRVTLGNHTDDPTKQRGSGDDKNGSQHQHKYTAVCFCAAAKSQIPKVGRRNL